MDIRLQRLFGIAAFDFRGIPTNEFSKCSNLCQYIWKEILESDVHLTLQWKNYEVPSSGIWSRDIWPVAPLQILSIHRLNSSLTEQKSYTFWPITLSQAIPSEKEPISAPNEYQLAEILLFTPNRNWVGTVGIECHLLFLPKNANINTMGETGQIWWDIGFFMNPTTDETEQTNFLFWNFIAQNLPASNIAEVSIPLKSLLNNKEPLYSDTIGKQIEWNHALLPYQQKNSNLVSSYFLQMSPTGGYQGVQINRIFFTEPMNVSQNGFATIFIKHAWKNVNEYQRMLQLNPSVSHLENQKERVGRTSYHETNIQEKGFWIRTKKQEIILDKPKETTDKPKETTDKPTIESYESDNSQKTLYISYIVYICISVLYFISLWNIYKNDSSQYNPWIRYFFIFISILPIIGCISLLVSSNRLWVIWFFQFVCILLNLVFLILGLFVRFSSNPEVFNPIMTQLGEIWSPSNTISPNNFIERFLNFIKEQKNTFLYSYIAYLIFQTLFSYYYTAENKSEPSEPIPLSSPTFNSPTEECIDKDDARYYWMNGSLFLIIVMIFIYIYYAYNHSNISPEIFYIIVCFLTFAVMLVCLSTYYISTGNANFVWYTAVTSMVVIFLFIIPYISQIFTNATEYIPIVLFIILLSGTLLVLGQNGKDGQNQAYVFILTGLTVCIYIAISRYTNMKGWILMIGIGVFLALLIWLFISSTETDDKQIQKPDKKAAILELILITIILLFHGYFFKTIQTLPKNWIIEIIVFISILGFFIKVIYDKNTLKLTNWHIIYIILFYITFIMNIWLLLKRQYNKYYIFIFTILSIYFHWGLYFYQKKIFTADNLSMYWLPVCILFLLLNIYTYKFGAILSSNMEKQPTGVALMEKSVQPGIQSNNIGISKENLPQPRNITRGISEGNIEQPVRQPVISKINKARIATSLMPQSVENNRLSTLSSAQVPELAPGVALSELAPAPAQSAQSAPVRQPVILYKNFDNITTINGGSQSPFFIWD